MAGAIYICGGDSGTAWTRDPLGDLDDCPHPLHDWPLPPGYVDASIEAGWRLRHRWGQRRCPDCRKYGWLPGKLTEAHVRRPAAASGEAQR